MSFAFRLRRTPRPRRAPTRTAAPPIPPAGISSVPLIAPPRLVDEVTREIVNVTGTFKRKRKDSASALVAHHMIRFTRDCTEGLQGAAFYADRTAPAMAATRPA